MQLRKDCPRICFASPGTLCLLHSQVYFALYLNTAVGGPYCRFFALKHGNAIFYERGISGRPVEWKDDPQLLQRWKAGTLGMPLVDANMRELAATGASVIV